MVKSVRVMIEKKIDLYKVLDIPRNADIEQIRRAYRDLALIHHPDKQGQKKKTEDADFNLIVTSYQILSDPALRKQYEKLLQPHDKNTLKPKKTAAVKAMQQKLRAKEVQATQAPVNVELLREEGIKNAVYLKRRSLQKQQVPIQVFMIYFCLNRSTLKRAHSLQLV